MDNAHNVDARNLYNTPEAMISVITLEPGQPLKRHITPVDVAFYLLSGTGVVEIGEEKQEVVADTLVESPKDIVHCWYNESTEPLRFMEEKTNSVIRQNPVIFSLPTTRISGRSLSTTKKASPRLSCLRRQA